MSRSYKKTPLFCDHNPGMKAYANRRFRRYKGPVQDGKWYRRYTNPWNIWDYKFGCYSRNEVVREVKEGKCPPPHLWWMKDFYTPLYRYYMK